MKVVSLEDFKKNLLPAEKSIPQKLSKAAQEDAEYLKTKIYERFDEAALKTPIKGYYLYGSGNVKPNNKTYAEEGDYYYKWKKPYISTNNTINQVKLDIMGPDTKWLEYGLSPISYQSNWWVRTMDDGSVNATNKNGSGNWFKAIKSSCNGTGPLISFGDEGSRFFAKYSEPTGYIEKGVDDYINGIRNNDKSLNITEDGLKIMIEEELNK